MKKKSWTEFQNYIATKHPAIDDLIKKRQKEQGVYPIGIRGMQYYYASRESGGFHWDITKEDRDFWVSLFEKQNTNVFYKKYPNLLNKQSIFDF